MPKEIKTYGVCPACQTAQTLRVDRQRNLMFCEKCKTWFGE